MQTESVVTASQASEVLADFCDRNASAELHLARPRGELVVARARLLAIRGERLYVDRPDGSPAQQFVEGQTLQVFVGVGTARWAFVTVVLERHAVLPLNAQHRVPAMVLRVPAEITNSQRRRDFRVSVASCGIGCAITRASTRFPAACDRNAERWNSSVANISARGMGLVVHHTGSLSISAGHNLFLDFTLPGIDAPLCLLGEVRHVRALREGDRYLLGIRFLPLPTLGGNALWQTLNQFVAEEQRRKLRRKR